MTICTTITSFSRPAYHWGKEADAAARVGACKHLNPLRQRVDDTLMEFLDET